MAGAVAAKLSPERGGAVPRFGMIGLLDDASEVSLRERELSAIITAYNEVTERLKESHERLASEVNRMAKELRFKNEALRRSERLAALGQMAAGLAHEIRNPLGGIALYASRLEGELSDRPDARKAAGKISQGVRSLNRLVSEILDFAQEDRLDRAPCEMDSILTSVMEQVRLWSAETGATITIAPDARAWVVDCDRDRMQQVLTNLLINAVQAAGPSGDVRLAARSLEGDAGVEIEVCDDGPGIPEDRIGRIFNPFYTTKSTGTGLGLAIAHRIVEAHGGTIVATNRAEGGARFVVRLPVSRSKKAVHSDDEGKTAENRAAGTAPATAADSETTEVSGR